MDTNLRIAHCIGRLARATPGMTSGAVRRRLSGPDRSHFVDACVLAVALGLVQVDGNSLIPGPVTPEPERRGRIGNTAALLAAALDQTVTRH